MNELTLKELLKEMQDRANEFERVSSLCEEVCENKYWEGKRSESVFMVEKLKWILEAGG